MTARTFRNALPPGHTVHWYRIDGVLGQGGFGITYLAHDTNLDHPVAIKEFLPMEMAMREADQSVQPTSQEHDERFRWGLDRFLAEARTLARFRHPGIVRVASVFEANNTAYMVMELEQGETLHALLARERTLPAERLRAMLMTLLDGLEVVHAAGFIHRDIKPANIMLRADGSPVLIDFGSARQAIGQQTRTLTTLISPGYAPYEQYLSGGDRQGPWTDIYSLAATMYRCIVGRPPIDALDRSEGLLKSERDLYMPACDVGEGNYPAEFLRAIDHGLRFRAADRPQTIGAWRRELDGEPVSDLLDTTTRIDLPIDIAGDTRRETSVPVATTLKAETPPPVVAPRSPRTGRWRPAAALLAAGAIAAGAWMWRGNHIDGAPVAPAAKPDDRPAAATASVEPALVATPGPAKPDAGTAANAMLVQAQTAAQQAGEDPVALIASAGQFRAVLRLAPDNIEAQAALGSIATRLAKVSMDRLRNNDLEGAAVALDGARGADASAPLVATAQQQLETVRAATALPASPPAPAEPTAAPAATAAVATAPAPAAPVSADKAHVTDLASTVAQPAGPADEVAELLRLAAADLKSNRLTAPRDRNAVDRFEQVLRLQPGNRDAVAGIDRVADRLAEMAALSIDRGAYGRASDLVNRGRALRPQQRRWSDLEASIAKARQQATAKQEQLAKAATAPASAVPAATSAPAPVGNAPSPTKPPAVVAVAAPPPPGIIVRVVGINADLKRFGLGEADVGAAVAARLKAAGYLPGSSGVTLKVELKYNVNTTTGVYSYATFVDASGTGAGGQPVRWAADDSGSVQERDLARLKGILLKEVDEFIANNPAR